LYVSICPAEKELMCEIEDTDPLGIDGFSASWKSVVGLSFQDNGNVCFLMGPILSLPGIEWDVTP
jgi:hypothetical protein